VKPYELVVLLHPDLEIDLDKPLKKIEGIIKQLAGKIAKSDTWGKRKLAYPIDHEDFAVYVYYEVELPVESIGKLEKAFNITDEVIRYLLTYPVPVSEDSEARKEVNKDDEDKDSKSDKED